MDNDNKINELQEAQTHKEVQLFLKDELKNLSYSKAAQYNLEEEYARTKQHKNRSVVIILCVCAVVVSLLVVGLTLFITSQNRKIKVNIDTFNDLNLRALLNSAGRTESLYASALQAKEMLVSQRDDELNAADQKRENDLYVLRTVSKVSSKDAIARKTLQIQEEYKKSIKSIREKYEPEIQAADAKIAEIKEKLSGYDSEKLSAAQADEAVLDSQKQLNDIQIRNLEKKYQNRISELKTQMILQQREAVKQQREAVEKVRKTYQAKIDLLDPDARSQSAIQDQIILETGIPKNAVSTAEIQFNSRFEPSDYLSQFKSPSEVFSSSVKNAADYLDGLNTIANRFSTIPLENTIRHYVPAMQRLAFSITTEMAQAQKQMQTQIDGLETEISKKNAQISEFQDTFEQICFSDKISPAHACIINSSDKNNLKLYVANSSKDLVPPEIQTFDAQIRDGKRIVCELTVTKNAQNYTAAPKNTTKNFNSDVLSAGARVYFVIPEPEVQKK